jgi:hypothetical protein
MDMSEKPFDLEGAATAAFAAIFAGKKSFDFGGKSYAVDTLKSSRLKAVNLGEYQCIEQNPRKDSQWAQKARDGHQIAWVFKGRAYVARLMDGEFTLLGKKHG